jgi:hypothetical protein
MVISALCVCQIQRTEPCGGGILELEIKL